MSLFVIIPQYNQVHLTLGAVSGIAQEVEPAHIIVVDGGSSENLKPIEESGVTLIRTHHNGGYGFLANAGAKFAIEKGATEILLLNNDILVKEPFIEMLRRTLHGSGNLAVVSPLIRDSSGHIWYSGGRVSWLRGNVYHTAGSPSTSVIETEFISGCAMLTSTQVLHTIGFFDETFFMYYEDADFCERCRRGQIKLLVNSDSTITHLVNSSDPTGDAYLRYAPANRLRWIRRYAPRAVKWLIYSVVYFRIWSKTVTADPHIAQILRLSLRSLRQN